MASIAIIGDGPAGLSAALFLARGGHDTTVYAQDDTLMHFADLNNYLGIESVPGPEFQRTARAQATAAGADIIDTHVEGLDATAGGVTVRTADGSANTDYVIIAGGKSSQELADDLGVNRAEGIVVDTHQRTSIERVYAAGHLVRPERSQAIISAGAGAIAALDILAREAGKDVHDWDSL